MLLCSSIFTVRIPKEWGKYCFHRSLFTLRGGGGSPFLPKWGPSSFLTKGDSIQIREGRCPHPRSRMGVSHPRSGQGWYPGGPGQDGGRREYPQPEQHSVYLLVGEFLFQLLTPVSVTREGRTWGYPSRGRKASWAHAGGLPCLWTSVD